MIAYAGALKYIYGEKDDFLLAPRTRWPVDLENNFSIGYGKRGRKV
jgi:N6-L-threonylcarbamoyladenine synthase